MPSTVSPKWSRICWMESLKASSPGLPSRLAKTSAPLPSSEYWTLALLTGSSPLRSQSLPASTAALSAAVSGASELYTTITGVPLASENSACWSASARLLSTLSERPLEASLVVTLWSLGPIDSAPAMTIQMAMTIQGCLPRTDHVMMRRMRDVSSPRSARPPRATSYWPEQARRGVASSDESGTIDTRRVSGGARVGIPETESKHRKPSPPPDEASGSRTVKEWPHVRTLHRTRQTSRGPRARRGPIAQAQLHRHRAPSARPSP